MKPEGKLRQNYLKGTMGDALNAILCAIGHNMRMILRTVRSLFVLICIYLLRSIQVRNDAAETIFDHLMDSSESTKEA